jgi:hypothetical protein
MLSQSDAAIIIAIVGVSASAPVRSSSGVIIACARRAPLSAETNTLAREDLGIAIMLLDISMSGMFQLIEFLARNWQTDSNDFLTYFVIRGASRIELISTRAINLIWLFCEIQN